MYVDQLGLELRHADRLLQRAGAGGDRRRHALLQRPLGHRRRLADRAEHRPRPASSTCSRSAAATTTSTPASARSTRRGPPAPPPSPPSATTRARSRRRSRRRTRSRAPTPAPSTRGRRADGLRRRAPSARASGSASTPPRRRSRPVRGRRLRRSSSASSAAARLACNDDTGDVQHLRGVAGRRRRARYLHPGRRQGRRRERDVRQLPLPSGLHARARRRSRPLLPVVDAARRHHGASAADDRPRPHDVRAPRRVGCDRTRSPALTAAERPRRRDRPRDLQGQGLPQEEDRQEGAQGDRALQGSGSCCAATTACARARWWRCG